MKKNLLLTLCCLLVAAAMNAQHIPTLEEAVYGGLIRTQGGGSVNWMKDGEHYSKMERNAEGTVDVMAYSAKDNSKEVLIPASKLVNPETGKPIPVRSFAFSDDNQKVLIYTNTRQVGRYDTRGDYWVLDIQSGKLQQVGKHCPEATLMFAKFSPDGTKVAYVSQNNIYAENLADGKVTPLTTDGSDLIVNGTFDWVYEEEFGCRDGFRWSPDSKYIAYWQSDTEGTGWFDIINNVDALYPTIQRFPYPKAGTTNSAVKVGYVSVEGGATTWVNIPGDAREHYIPRMEFIPGCNELFIQQMNRPQNTNKVWTIQIGGTEPTNIFTDTDAAWLETNDNIHWLKNNQYFTWESERSGYRHLYRVSRDGKEIIPITKGDFDYIREVGMDIKKGVVYFIASPDNFTQRYLYEAKLFGKGEVKRLSPMDQSGQHSYSMSPTGKWAVHTFSNTETPPVIDMVSFPGHKHVRLITDNAEAKQQYQALGLQPKEFFQVRSDELLLDGWMIKPANFDPNKKYPMIVNFYERNSETLNKYHMPEPHRSTIDYSMYLSNGYIVFNPDNRYRDGYPGESCYNCVMPGIQEVLSRGYVDEKKIGAQGHSWGGYQVAYLATRTRLFAAIESGAPVVNMFSAYGGIRWGSGLARSFQYEHTQSRLGATPWSDPRRYYENSPLFLMDKVETPILIMHNDQDGHVPWYQGIEYFVALKRLGKPAWMLNYTGEPHWPTKTPNKLDFQIRMKQFFDHFLKGEPMPKWMK